MRRSLLSLSSLLVAVLRLAARLLDWLDRRAALSAAQRAAVAEAALEIARRTAAARRIEEEVERMKAEDVRRRLEAAGDFR